MFVQNDVSLNNNLFVQGDISLNSKLFVQDDVSLNSKLFVQGDISLNSKLFVEDDVSLNSKLFVEDDVSLNSKLFVQDDVQFYSTLTVDNETNLNSLSVTSLNAGSGTIQTSGLIEASTLEVDDSSFNNNVDISGDLTVLNGDVSFNNNVKIGNELTIYNNVEIGNELIVNSNAIFNTTITGSINGNAETATALETARNIGGVSFDGTANINLPGVNTSGTQNTTGSSGSCSGTSQYASYLWSSSNHGQYYIQAGWDGSYWKLEAGNHSNGTRVDYANTAGSNNGYLTNQHLRTTDNATFKDIYANSWLRTYNNTGWYNETHGGGIYMTDSTTVKTYGNKHFQCNYLYAERAYVKQTAQNPTSTSWIWIFDFTGSHGNNNNFNFNVNIDYNGLIVSCTDQYINKDYSMKPKISESLPLTKLTTIENDKAVFGVVAYQEDASYNINKFKVNSLGEGAIWVTNKNGNLDIGDYISSSIITGYGQKQNDDLLHNYTVAKITCNCEFSLVKQIKQKLITISNENYTNEEYVQIGQAKDIDHKQYILYDDNGNIQYEDDLDTSGNQIYEYKFDTRFLDASANILSGEEDYLARLNAGENVYIACFVGCTYHCG